MLHLVAVNQNLSTPVKAKGTIFNAVYRGTTARGFRPRGSSVQSRSATVR